ncbi:MAG: hypothetical protein AAF648_09685 [Pseudomonadota bacterium]
MGLRSRVVGRGVFLLSLLVGLSAHGEGKRHYCPMVPMNSVILERLDEARNKYFGNCLRCEGERCRFNDGLNANETAICHALYCQPVKVKAGGFTDMPYGLDGAVEYSYVLTKRGQLRDIRVTTDLSNSKRQELEAFLKSGNRVFDFRPIRVDGKRYRLEGLWGEMNLSTELPNLPTN